MATASAEYGVPILLIVFNRLDPVKETLAAIRAVKPRQLFVAGDGPRKNRPGEAETCREVREYILGHIDWPCEVKVRFQDENLGCRNGVSSAVSWFFDEVSEGIVLEDDCKPSSDFFRYAAAALEFYRDDERIMHINGSSFVHGVDAREYCAYLYRYAHVWGWASWRRAWRYYDVEMEKFDPRRTFEYFPEDRKQARRWNEIIKNVRAHRPGFDTWDFQWTFAILSRGAWCVSPIHNLITNIGREQSTHDMNSVSGMLGFPVEELPETLLFPKSRFQELPELEKQIYDTFWRKSNLMKRLQQCWPLIKK